MDVSSWFPIQRVSVLFWQHMNWRIIMRFVAPMPIGVYLGLQVYDRLDPVAIQLVIAAFVLVSLLVRAPKSAAGAGGCRHGPI